jgi:hypothetical protein
MTRQDFTKEQVNDFVKRYECFIDTNKQKFLYLKEQYKNNNVDNLSSKIRVSSSYEKAINCLPPTQEQAKTRQEIVDTNNYTSGNQFSACLSASAMYPFNKKHYTKDIENKTYYCNDTTNKIKDLLANTKQLEKQD